MKCAMVGGTESDDALVLRVMVAMAGADGDIDARETSTIADLHERVTGHAIAEDDIARAAEAERSGGPPLGETLSAAAAGLDKATKERIIRAAYLVLLADGEIAAQERKKLRDIASALRVPEVHFGAIMEDVAVWLARGGERG